MGPTVWLPGNTVRLPKRFLACASGISLPLLGKRVGSSLHLSLSLSPQESIGLQEKPQEGLLKEQLCKMEERVKALLNRFFLGWTYVCLFDLACEARNGL